MSQQPLALRHEDVSRMKFWVRRAAQFKNRKSKTDPDEEKMINENRKAAWEDGLLEKTATALSKLTEDQQTACALYPRLSERYRLDADEEAMFSQGKTVVNKLSGDLGIKKPDVVLLIHLFFYADWATQ